MFIVYKPLKNTPKTLAQQNVPLVPALRRLKKEDRQFHSCLGYTVKPRVNTLRMICV